ncbi:nitroreductase/quinone reductase family protein [Nocardia transvalensis]|uniref:nitroreductase/quinone reductase family protein n=1 Tax=Nocardia transvalensis TaxID=37333 RepID=UPI001E526AFE|nr:nitroreductase/quinone reductase family protein [Nocardia transvalensis]
MRLLARINRYLTNPLFRVVAGRVRGYANIVHTGRRSGRSYRTPVGITWDGNQLMVAVNYGATSDWVRNIVTAGAFRLEHRGRSIAMDRPELARIGGRDFLIAERAPA